MMAQFSTGDRRRKTKGDMCALTCCIY
uniref:Uncharacterized protein n=1 Tax=Arundo donax TaxID=35708 RepID=A0A0A9FWV1_ARUDO